MTKTQQRAQREITRNGGRLVSSSEDGNVWRIEFPNFKRLASVYDVLFDQVQQMDMITPARTTLVIYF